MKAENGVNKRSFWITLPGILTACAALITAIGGLIAGLNKVGLLRPSSPANDSPPSGQTVPLEPAPPVESEQTSTLKPKPAPTVPPRQTLKITLQPIIEGMGTLQGKSGSLIEGSSVPFSPPSLGDRQDRKEVRCFISFSLSPIPKAAEITKVTLHLVKGGASGNLNQNYFGTILIESLDIGEALDGSDFGKSAVLVKQVPLSRLQSEPHDVTQEIHRARLSGQDTITFRLRFSVGHDNDNESDSWALSYSRGQTRLEVTVASGQ